MIVIAVPAQDGIEYTFRYNANVQQLRFLGK